MAVPTDATYDPNNVFAKILNGDLPSHKVYEDQNTFAFMDIMPRVDGHTLVIPKNPARNIFDANTNDLAAVINTVQKISKAAMVAFKADGLIVQQFNEAPAGQVVFHLHFHILPRVEGVDIRPPGINAENDILERHADLLREALSQS